jgi:ribosome recycling factor
MIEDIKKDAAARMKKSIESLAQEFARMRTGRANTSLLDHVKVPYYGNDVPLSQTASVSVADARTLTITPWEKSMVPVVEKAIMTSELGLNPSTAGNVIRVAIPPLTEERRRDMIKVARAEAESARVAIRNIRRDANNDCKELLKEKEITEDQGRHAEDEIQKLTDKFISDVDKLLTGKEADLMEI